MIVRLLALEMSAALTFFGLGSCRTDPRAGMHFTPLEAAPVAWRAPAPRPQVVVKQETPPVPAPKDAPAGPPAPAPAPAPAKETPPPEAAKPVQDANVDERDEARARDEIAFENDYLRMKERLVPQQLGKWLVIMDGRVLPSDERGRPSPTATMADCLAVADGVNPTPMHRFVFQIGEEGDVLYAESSRAARSAVGSALRSTLGISAGYDARSGELTWARGEKTRRYTLDHEHFPIQLSDPLQRQSMVTPMVDSSGFGGFVVLEAGNAVLLDGARFEIPGRVLLKTGDGMQELRRMRVRLAIPELDVDVTVPAAAWPR
jgi:hypothetical protein